MGDQLLMADDLLTADDAESPVDLATPGEFGPLYAQLLELMQRGLWRDAEEMLTALEARFPTWDQLLRSRRLLRLHLSAEGSWSRGERRLSLSGRLVIRTLLIVNVLLYSFLLALWLLGSSATL